MRNHINSGTHFCSRAAVFLFLGVTLQIFFSANSFAFGNGWVTRMSDAQLCAENAKTTGEIFNLEAEMERMAKICEGQNPPPSCTPRPGQGDAFRHTHNLGIFTRRQTLTILNGEISARGISCPKI